jgi:hypothetical protein
MARSSFIIYNSTMVTIAAPVAQPTGTVIRTMMQLKLATGLVGAVVIGWSASCSASTAITPGTLELVECDVGATALTTAYAAADIQTYGQANATANTAGVGGTPFNLGTSASGFSTAAVTEGTPTATRMADVQQIDPAFTPYGPNYWPLAREFELIPQRFLRVRATFSTTTNLITYVLVEV